MTEQEQVSQTTQQKIEDILIERQLSWAELSRKSQVSCTHLSKIRTGEILQPTMVTVRKLAGALNVSYLKLLPDE